MLQYSPAALVRDSQAIIALADHEGLWSHAQSVRLRCKLVEQAFEQVAAEQASVVEGADSVESSQAAQSASDQTAQSSQTAQSGQAAQSDQTAAESTTNQSSTKKGN